MASTRDRAVKRRIYVSHNSNDENENIFDSDDSVKDKDYVESDCDSDSSMDTSDEVSKIYVWLIPLFSKLMRLIIIISSI